MRTKNLTPFLFGFRVTSRKPPQLEMTAVVRATFLLQPDGKVTVPEGHPLLVQGAMTAEVYRDEDSDRLGECLYPGDFADFKLNAELMLAGTCHTPNQKPMLECPVHFAVGRWSKNLRVVGQRVFTNNLLGRAVSDPIPFTRMPLTYANAYGGPGYELNPVGKGYGGTELPNVENAGDVIHSPRERLRPAGFGPLSPSWPDRKGKRGHAGSKGRVPFYTDDFNWSYFQAAPPDQQIEGYLAGDEELIVQNLHPTRQILSTRLPGLRIRVFVNDNEAHFREIPMVLDTLFADLDKETVTLTFRGLTPVKELDLSDVKTALIASEELSEAPLTKEHYRELLERYEADPYEIQDRVPEHLQPVAKEVLHHGRLAPPDGGREGPSADPISALLREKLGDMAPAEQDRVRKAVASILATPAPAGVDLRAHIKKALDSARAAPAPAAAPVPGVVNLRDARTSGALQKLHALVEKLKVDADKKNVKLKGLDAYEAALRDPRLAPPQAPLEEPGPGKDLSGQDLSGRDLRGRDLRGANFTGAILAGADLGGAQLTDACLKQAILTEADLTGADLTRADLTNANARGVRGAGAILRGATLDQTSLVSADLKGADLSEAKGQMALFMKADLTGAKATRARFEKVLFREAVLVRADLTSATLIRCYFGECDITEARFDDATLTKTSFAGANATRASFVGAHGEGAVWMDASLVETDFSYASLERAFFLRAKALRARFFGANLPGAQLYRAVIEDSDVTSANLAGANLANSTLTGTRFNDSNLFETSFAHAAGTRCDFNGANLKRSTLEKP